MFNFKKYFTNELMQVALILSLLRIDRRTLEYNVPAIGIGTDNLTDSWDQSNILIPREGRVHPKSIDSVLLNYEQEVFEELNSLGRYGNIFDLLTPRNFTAYLLSVEESQNLLKNSEEAASSESSASAEGTEDVSALHKKTTDSEQLSQEDLDLIEILWKYDINAISNEFLEEVSDVRNVRTSVAPPDEPHAPDGSLAITPEISNFPENIVPINSSKVFRYENDDLEGDEEEFRKQFFTDDLTADPWFGASNLHSITTREQADIEDYNAIEIPLIELENEADDEFISPFGPVFSLEESNRMTDMNSLDSFPMDFDLPPVVKTEIEETVLQKEEEVTREDPGIEADFLDDDVLEDLVTIFDQPEFSTNLANVVSNDFRGVYSANSDLVNGLGLSLTHLDDSSLQMFETVITNERPHVFKTEYKQDHTLDLDGCSESSAGHSSFVEEEFQAEDETHSMQMVDSEFSIERGTDSDSAVSSMGSERVSSLYSDAELMGTNSDLGHTANHLCIKYNWFDDLLCGTHSPSVTFSPSSSDFQEQNINYHVIHNHTYHVTAEALDYGDGEMQKSIIHDKKKSKSGRKTEDLRMTRDERRARNLNIPISVNDIINLPIDNFNEQLSIYDVSDSQFNLIRDIRRRGKNKVAAQNCRKRKMDQITNLEEEVKQVKDYKYDLVEEQKFLLIEKQRMQDKYMQIRRHVFSNLPYHERENFIIQENKILSSSREEQISEMRTRSKNRNKKK